MPAVRGETLSPILYCYACERDFSREVQHSKKGQLTKEQTDSQDRMDSACFQLIETLAPHAKWDMESMGSVRDGLIATLTKHYGLKEFDLYPWLLEPKHESDGVKMGRVVFKAEYPVDLANGEMIEHARTPLYDDLFNLFVKTPDHGEEFESYISTVEDPSLTEGDIPEWLATTGLEGEDVCPD